MYKNETLSTLAEEKSSIHIIDPIKNTIESAKHEQTKKIVDIKPLTISYPTNGLYGLL